jgi:hypothetical protein
MKPKDFSCQACGGTERQKDGNCAACGHHPLGWKSLLQGDGVVDLGCRACRRVRRDVYSSHCPFCKDESPPRRLKPSEIRQLQCMLCSRVIRACGYVTCPQCGDISRLRRLDISPWEQRK